MGELHDEWLRAVSVVVAPELCAAVLIASTPVDTGVAAKAAQDHALATAAVAEAA